MQFAPALTICAEAHVSMLGAVVSTTVIVAVQVELLPAASVAVIVTVFAPNAATAPAAGDWVTVTLPLLSFAVTPAVKLGINAEQLLAASKVADEAQTVIVGAVVSITWKLVRQPPVLPAASSTAMLTLIVPIGTKVPAGGNWMTCVTAQLSVATSNELRFGRNAAPDALAEAV